MPRGKRKKKEITEKAVVSEPTEKLVPDKGEKIRVVNGESKAWNKTETVPGINEGKRAKFSPVV